MKTKLEDLRGRRILVLEKQRGYSGENKIKELKILEVSPSKDWVKIMDEHGNKIWKSYTDISPIEILTDLEKHPNSETK